MSARNAVRVWVQTDGFSEPRDEQPSWHGSLGEVCGVTVDGIPVPGEILQGARLLPFDGDYMAFELRVAVGSFELVNVRDEPCPVAIRHD